MTQWCIEKLKAGDHVLSRRDGKQDDGWGWVPVKIGKDPTRWQVVSLEDVMAKINFSEGDTLELHGDGLAEAVTNYLNNHTTQVMLEYNHRLDNVQHISEALGIPLPGFFPRLGADS